MDNVVFTGNLLAFIGLPLLIGIAQRHAHRPVALAGAGLLLLCPVVYAITDRLAVEFERLRDIFFLGTFSTLVFVSAIWLVNCYRCGRWPLAVAALVSLSLAAVGVFVLLGLVMYLE